MTYMKKIMVLSIAIFAGSVFQRSFCQTELIQTINSSGTSYEKGSILLNWSIGEMSLVTAMEAFDGTIVVTNGVLQPEAVDGGPILTSSPTQIPVELTATQLKVFPNPASNILQVEYANPSASKIELRLTDINGKLIYEKSVMTFGNGFTEQINISSLSAGTYVLTMRNGDLINAKPMYTYKILKL